MLKFAGVATIALFACFSTQAMAQDAGAIDWSGFYAGVHGGYWQGSYTQQGDYADLPSLSNTSNFSGYNLGVQLGSITSFGGLALGIEADADWTNASFTEVDPTSVFNDIRSGQLNWTGAITAKLGAQLDRIMPYVLGGVALASSTVTVNGDSLGLGSPISGNALHVGYVLGAGVAMQLTDHVSTFLEARYADYGVAQYDFGGGRIQPGALAGTSVRVGLNFGM